MQLKPGYLLLDGPTGTQLVTRGFQPTDELWTARAALDAPDLLRSIHLDYLRAGAQVITANTFRTTSYAAERAGLKGSDARKMAHASLAIATEAIEEFTDQTQNQLFLAGSLAPVEDCYSPRLVPPLDVLERSHLETASWLVDGGCDVVLVETMGTAREALVAVRAARKAKAPSVMISFITDGTGRRLLGGDPLLETAKNCVASGAEAVLVNCVHPDVVDLALAELSSLPDSGIMLGAYANASKMHLNYMGEVSWEPDTRPEKEQAEAYAKRAMDWFRKYRVRIIGSCCGTTPEHIKQLAAALKPYRP